MFSQEHDHTQRSSHHHMLYLLGYFVTPPKEYICTDSILAKCGFRPGTVCPGTGLRRQNQLFSWCELEVSQFLDLPSLLSKWNRQAARQAVRVTRKAVQAFLLASVVPSYKSKSHSWYLAAFSTLNICKRCHDKKCRMCTTFSAIWTRDAPCSCRSRYFDCALTFDVAASKSAGTDVRCFEEAEA